MTVEQHNEALLRAFGKVLTAEERVREAKTFLAEAEARLKPEIAAGESALEKAWQEIATLLAETGEVEVTLPGAANDFRIGWGSPRESVKVDPEAAPDEFVKIERKPKLKEIGDHLKALREQNMPLPNWARFERGERKLGYKVVKKS